MEKSSQGTKNFNSVVVELCSLFKSCNKLTSDKRLNIKNFNKLKLTWHIYIYN